MKEESEERKEQSKERTRKDKKKERVRVEDNAKGKRKRKAGRRGRAPGWLWEMGRVTGGRDGRPRMNGNTKMARAR